jgi:hypothetical protein
MDKQTKEATIEVWTDNMKKYDFIHGHLGFECDTCSLIPETINCIWLYDKEKKRQYLRYECFNCTEKIFKVPGYLNNFIGVLRVSSYCTFPDLDKIENILFIAKHFLIKQNGQIKII